MDPGTGACQGAGSDPSVIADEVSMPLAALVRGDLLARDTRSGCRPVAAMARGRAHAVLRRTLQAWWRRDERHGPDRHASKRVSFRSAVAGARSFARAGEKAARRPPHALQKEPKRVHACANVSTTPT